MKRIATLMVVLLAAAPAYADDEVADEVDAAPRPVADRQLGEIMLRVLSQRATVRTGPSLSYREVYVAQRGQTFEVLERARTDYWFKVMLEDGTTGWIPGDDVLAVEVAPTGGGLLTRIGRALRRTFMAPPRIADAHAALSFSAGMLDGEGVFVLRPQVLLEDHAALEFAIGLSPRAQSDAFLAGVGMTLRLWPDAVIDPFASLGVGAAHIRPKADNFVDEKQTLMTVAAGGGLELTFKKQITVRLDARRWMFFDPNQAEGGTEFSGGLSVFF